MEVGGAGGAGDDFVSECDHGEVDTHMVVGSGVG